jgi:hypothetical protein
MIFTGCEKIDRTDRTDDGNSSESMFVLIENGEYWKVVYHRETKVMYIMSVGLYNKGNFVVMVDADGKPVLYKEDKKDANSN